MHNKLHILTAFLLIFFLQGCACKSGSSDPAPVCDTCSCITTLEICQKFTSPCDTCLSCSEGSVQEDPLYSQQWHLENTVTPDEDINVIPAWTENIKGDHVLIAIVDDGMDAMHEDLAGNVIPSLNYNYLTGSTNINSGEHGTAVAGLAAARDLNNLGVRGVAPCASLACFNMLQMSTTSTVHDAMIRYRDVVSVSNNSWGPEDDTGQLMPAESVWQQGIDEGITTGRNGLGIVYVWAAGNGGSMEIDNSNYDGYANYYGVMAVGSVDKDGIRSYYSEKGANLWVCTPAGTYVHGFPSEGVTTTDITGSSGYNNANDSTGNYTTGFTGTSAAAPIASGAAALVLRANRSLTWRDVRIILAQSARKNDSLDGDWTSNGAGYNINYKYGFGVIDASKAVNFAKTWTNVGPLITYTSPTMTVNAPIPDNAGSASSTITVSSSGITKIEYVAITVNITHPASGELEITLTAPTQNTSSEYTQSVLSEKHDCYTSSGNPTTCTYFTGGASYTFGSARHLDEAANGTWTLTVKDLSAVNPGGTLNSWSLKIYGN